MEYWEKLYLVNGHQLKTTLSVLNTYLTHMESNEERVVLFVDYLQKVPVISPGYELSEEKQIRIVTEGLKNLSMVHRIPIMAIAVSDADGLKNEQARFQDLWGGSSVQYERDVAIMLNSGNAGNVVLAIEKNRMGPVGQGITMKMYGSSFAFESNIGGEKARR